MPNDAITQGQIKLLMEYNPETGTFTWKVRPRKGRVCPGDTAGTVRADGYVIIRISQVRYRAHRLAFLYMTGEWPPHEVDHIDGNPSNNSWENLRLATPCQNQQNQKLRKNNKSGYAGVSRRKDGKWQAHIKAQGRNIYLGMYPTAKDAGDAYNEAKQKVHTFCPQVRC